MAVSKIALFRIYNTLTRKVEILQPIKKNKVSLYTCGPTVYNYAHIGNLRTYIFEDVLERTLARNGYKVRRVMNITDVGHLTSDADQGEDKIEKEAAKEKKTVWEIAKFYTNAFLKDAKKINIKIPRLLVPATKTIPEQIRIIEILASKGLAYETPKAIYFDVSKFKDYTKLSRQPLSEKITAAREEVVSDPGKRNPADFVLWFKLVDHFKHHVMRWRSLWGEGFPGWHIECSAISTKYLGQPFDIHTGGIDHVGVHHTNEIAQSEGAFDRPLANYWMHGEFLTVNQDRMGKSLGNFITLRDLQVKGFDPLAYRYLILTSHYRSRLDFSFESLRAAANGYHSLKNRLLALKNIKINIKGKDARAADDHLALHRQLIFFDHGVVPARVHGFRPRLDDKKLAGLPVFGPFHIHRRPFFAQLGVMLFDDHGPARQSQNLAVIQHEIRFLPAGRADYFGLLHALAGLGVNHLVQLLAQTFVDDRPQPPIGQALLPNQELIRRDLALHDHFAQPPGAVYEHCVAETGLGVQGEHHPGRALV